MRPFIVSVVALVGLAVLLAATHPRQAATNDEAAIRQAVQYYFDAL